MTTLSVLTLNCWGLKYVSKQRAERLSAIGNYLADSEYEIVGLQECWVYSDFVSIREKVREKFPYAKFWRSGVFGSGLVVLSRYPIIATTIHRFTLTGRPIKIFQGDWFVGKCCVSTRVLHPTCGEIEVFNTHLHAGYDPKDKPDSYLGHRVSEGWEMACLLRNATSQGRHVLSLGDYNSDPENLVVKLLTRHAGLTDSWGSLHPIPSPPPTNLTPEESIVQIGVTCDSPLNKWTRHATRNSYTKQPVGERLDYIFYKRTPALNCVSAQVVLTDNIPQVGVNYSDHYGVHAQFKIAPPTATAVLATADDDEGLDPITATEVLNVLNSHSKIAAETARNHLVFGFGPFLLLSLLLTVTLAFVPFGWLEFLLGLVIIAVSCFWLINFFAGFLFGGIEAGAFENAIAEVDLHLQTKTLVVDDTGS